MIGAEAKRGIFTGFAFSNGSTTAPGLAAAGTLAAGVLGDELASGASEVASEEVPVVGAAGDEETGAEGVDAGAAPELLLVD